MISYGTLSSGLRMNNNIVILLHKIVEDKIVSTIRDERDFITKDMVIRTFLPPEHVKFDIKKYAVEELSLNVPNFDSNDSMVLSKIDNSEAAEPESFRINFPTLIKCQNCETNFPTKYQYQRHQCEFDAEKAYFKSPDDNKNMDGNENKVKYDCPICSKQFVSKGNLDRHRAGHENVKENICEHCNKHFVSESRLRIHKENHCKKAGEFLKFYRSDVTVWKCKKCHEVFSSVEIANFHVSICTEIMEYEPETTEREDDLQTELKGTHKNLLMSEYFQPKKGSQPEDRYIEKISTEILLQCEFCNRTYSDKNLLLMHQRKHTTEKNFECVNCNNIFDSYSSASVHWLKKCSELTNFFYLPKLTYCEYCDRTFKSHEILYNHKIKKKHYTPKLHMAVNLDRHKNEHNVHLPASDNKDIINKLIEDVLKTLEVPVNNKNVGDTNDKITVIDIKTEPGDTEENITAVPYEFQEEKRKRGRKRKMFKNAPKSKRYCTTTDEGFKYQCERCIKIFNTISELETHRSSEHVASFCCEECGQNLNSAKALLIHCRAHKSLKPYVCDTCGRSYSQTSHLWQHMRFHQGIKPFACPHDGCEARYTIRPDLKDHIRKVHTRERPFKCTVCNKCFLTGSVYYQHRLIHTNDRRYGCEICHKRFFRADALNNHKRIHTNERPYPCNICGREFRQKGDRNKHVRTQHPNLTSII